MAISDADFKTWIETPGQRREWLLELDHWLQHWRLGLEANAYDGGGVSSIPEIPIEGSIDRPLHSGSWTAVARVYRDSTAPAISGAQTFLTAGGLELAIDSSLQIKMTATDATPTSVSATCTSVALTNDTEHKVLAVVDAAANLVTVYLDDVALTPTLDISTLGAFSATERCYTELSRPLQVTGLQVFDTALPEAERQKAGSANPPGSIVCWAAIPYPTVKTTNADSGDDVDMYLHSLDLLTGAMSAPVVYADYREYNTLKAYKSDQTSTTEYYSLGGFVSAGDDTPAHQPYDARLIDIPTFAQSLSNPPYGAAVEAVAGVVLNNRDGALDFLRSATLADQRFALLVGDPEWSRADFRVIKGVAQGATFGVDTVALALGGYTAALDLPINREPERPVTIGTNKYIPANDGYKMSPKAGEYTLTTVYDKGVSVAFTDNGDQTFTLTNSPVGQITYATSTVTGATEADQVITASGVLRVLLTSYAAIPVSDLDSSITDSYLTAWPGNTRHANDPRGIDAGVHVPPAESQAAFPLADDIARGLGCVLYSKGDKLALDIVGGDLVSPPAASEYEGDSANITQQVLARRTKRSGVGVQSYANRAPNNDVLTGTTGQINDFKRVYFNNSEWGGEGYVGMPPDLVPFFDLEDAFDSPTNREFLTSDGAQTYLTGATGAVTKLLPRIWQVIGFDARIYRIDVSWLPWLVYLGAEVIINVPGRTRPIRGWVVGKSAGKKNYLDVWSVAY